MSDDIEKRLQALELARKNMQTQLEATSVALDAITEKIDDLKARQDARQQRSENQNVSEATTQSESTKEKAAKKLTEQAKRTNGVVANAAEHVRLVPEGLTNEDVQVRPKEDKKS